MSDTVPTPAPGPGRARTPRASTGIARSRRIPRPTAGSTSRRIVVALDGPASSGKSSVGAAAAGRLGLRFVDTGLLYRALTALALREGVATDDAEALVALVGRVALADDGTGRLTRVLLDGEDATGDARTHEVDAAVSAVSRVPEVRRTLLSRQRTLAADGGIVVAGRDIGTVVLPDADLKLFLDASVEERAARRIEELGLDPQGEEAALVRDQLRARDAQDTGRAVAPLRAAEDARHIRTDGNTFNQTVDLVVAEIRAAEAPSATPPAATTAERAVNNDAEPAATKPSVRPAPTSTPARVPAATTRLARNLEIERATRFDNHQTTMIRFIETLSRIGARLFADVRHEGLEHIPAGGGVILALNHVSNADVFMSGPWISHALRRRRIHWLGKKELFGWPVFGWIAAKGGIHPVDRSTADVDAFRLASELLERGCVLLAFPEGTRSPDGRLQEAKDGVAMLALRTGATIVPIGINNTDAVWPKGRKVPLPLPRHRVTVRIGEPFRLADLVPPGTDRRAAKSVATRLLMGRIAELLDERHRGVYADAVRPGADRQQGGA